MSAYIGIQSQISRNNRLTALYLLAFPLLIFATLYALMLRVLENEDGSAVNIQQTNQFFLATLPYTGGTIVLWFLIAFLSHSKMINKATGARPLERRENMRVYNLVENLCMSEGMQMPKVNIIEDPAMNAFASGLSHNNFSLTFSSGIIDNLNDEELKAVIAHELMHIKNRDVRLLVITIVFVGIFSFAAQRMFAASLFGVNAGSKRGRGFAAFTIVVIAYLLAVIFKMGLSREREYAADAGASELTRNPAALASALRKISGNSELSSVRSMDVKEMFICNQSSKSHHLLNTIHNLFSTHPPIEKRIQILEGF